jgi:predicted ATPase/DNA-binding winged helix-turn-helix (wHTH) protein
MLEECGIWPSSARKVMILKKTDSNYQFGGFQLNASNRTLFWNDELILLGGRAMDLLIALTEHHGKLLTKTQLLGAAWGNSCVHDSNLKVTIASLRRSLRQHEPTAEYIKTVVGRGYWFDASTSLSSKDDIPLQNLPYRSVPLPLTPMIFGRAKTITELRHMMGLHRLTTVVGPGGIGKTTVAIAVAQQFESECGTNTTYIDLGSVATEEFVIAKIATALGIASTRDQLEGISTTLAGRNALLLIDTCEHVKDLVAHVCNVLLAKTVDVRIIATSRQVLGAKDEQIFWLGPLDTPAAGLRNTNAIFRCSSVQLLAARAYQYGGYALQDDDAHAIGNICRSLDGVPLALDFVSPRLARQSAHSVFRELDHRLRILRRNEHVGPLRQQTLQITLEWSYALLTRTEACVLRAMSIFAGPFDTDALVQVIGCSGNSADHVFDALNGLRLKSMLAIDFASGQMRYRLLDTTRIFARELLRNHGEYLAVALRHARYQLEMQNRGRSEHASIPAPQWHANYCMHVDDFRSALQWALHEKGDVLLGIQLVAAGLTLWQELSLGTEARQNCTLALQEFDRIGIDDEKLKLSLIVGNAASDALDTDSREHAIPLLEEAVRLAREVGDYAAESKALASLVIFKLLPADQSELDSLSEALSQLREVALASNDPYAIREAQLLRATWDIFRGNLTDAYSSLKRLKSELRSSTVAATSRFHINQKLTVDVQLGGASWLVGKPGEALLLTEHAARELSEHHHGLTLINGLAKEGIWVFLQCHDYINARAYTDILRDHVYSHGMTNWIPVANLYSEAINVAMQDNGSEEKLRLALGALQEGPAQLANLSYLVIAINAMIQMKAFEAAAKSLHNIFLHSPRLTLLPELLRLRAATERALVSDVVAQATLVEAMQMANRVGAVAWQLRAATDLAELLWKNGEIEKARRTLVPVFAQFSDGFSTGDLISAQRLLRELG